MTKTENVHEGCEPRRKPNSGYKERFKERFAGFYPPYTELFKFIDEELAAERAKKSNYKAVYEDGYRDATKRVIELIESVREDFLHEETEYCAGCDYELSTAIKVPNHTCIAGNPTAPATSHAQR